MKRHRHFIWLLTGLMVMALTLQALAAVSMPCRGTAACCCRSSSMDMSMPGGAPLPPAHDRLPGCCETTPAAPCDIERDSPPAMTPYIPPPSGERVDAPGPFGVTVAAIQPAGTPCKQVIDRLTTAQHGDPPRYIEIQTILR